MKRLFTVLWIFVFLSVFSSAASASDGYIDNHMHLWSTYMASFFDEGLKDAPPTIVDGEPYYMPYYSSGRDLIEVLDFASFKKGTALSSAYLWGGLFFPHDDAEYASKKENNYAAAQCMLYGDRLTFLASIDPLQDFAVREVERCAKALGAKGLKMHFNVARLDVTNEEHMKKLTDVLKAAEANGIPVLIHYFAVSWPELPFTPESFTVFLERTVGTMPDLKMQLAHAAGSLGCGERVSEIRQALLDFKRKNPEAGDRVWIDISGTIVDEHVEKLYAGIPGDINRRTTPTEAAAFREFLRDFGMDRVLFASDWGGAPTMHPKPYLKLLRDELGLTDGELNKILTNRFPWKK